MLQDIKWVLHVGEQRPYGLDVYDEVFDSPTFFPLQRKKELAWMMQQARKLKPRTVMEIGTDKGGGLFHWIKSLPTVTNVIACEIRGTPYSSLFEQSFPETKFLWMPHCSRTPDLRRTIRKSFGGIDCLFIDGEKARFEDDFDHYLPLMMPGGLVFMHDVTDPSPGEAFRRVKEKTRFECATYVNTEDSQRAVREFKEGTPDDTIYEGWLRHWNGRSCGVGLIKIPEE